MIDPPQLADNAAQLTAVIRLTIPRSEIRKVMGPGIHELLAMVTAQGVAITGRVFSRHFRMDPETFDFEIGVPVAATILPSGRVTPSELPAARVIRTIYHGAYEGLGAAWGDFDSWIGASKYQPGPDLWECYLEGPETSPDPSQWRTELNRPLLVAG